MTASPEERGTVRPATGRTGVPDAGNAGELIGAQEIGGQLYARYRATPGTWVSASLQQQGYGRLYSRDTGYGAYTGVVRAPDGSPLANPDRVRAGQEYLVPVLRSPQPAPSPVPAPVSAPAPASASAPASAPARATADPAAGARLAAAEEARGAGNRYGVSQPPPPPLAAGVAPLFSPVVRPALDALARAGLRWGGAEVLSGGAGTATATGGLTMATVGVGLIAAASLAWGGYEAYGAYREWQSLEQARADSRDLQRQVQRNAHRLWQNGFMTDEEYFLYLATGVLVIQPDRPLSHPARASESTSIGFELKTATDQRWWYILWLGNAYNKARLFDYPFNEVYVEGPPGVRYRVDATDLKEIISRKFTQFAAISEETGIKYVREMVEKYRPGTPIAKVPSSEGILKLTKVLKGRMILSVPVQRRPIPRAVLEEAKRLGVTIRDDFGNEFNLDQPQPAYQPPVKLESAAPDAGFSPGSGSLPGAGANPGHIELTE